MDAESDRKKLRLDFPRVPPLRVRMVGDGEQRREVIRRLFYLITIAAEDAAAIAVEGQSPSADVAQQQELAARLRSAGETIEIVASAVEALLSGAEGSVGDRDLLEREIAPERRE